MVNLRHRSSRLSVGYGSRNFTQNLRGGIAAIERGDFALPPNAPAQRSRSALDGKQTNKKQTTSPERSELRTMVEDHA
jgi:hypothetical protein